MVPGNVRKSIDTKQTETKCSQNTFLKKPGLFYTRVEKIKQNGSIYCLQFSRYGCNVLKSKV